MGPIGSQSKGKSLQHEQFGRRASECASHIGARSLNKMQNSSCSGSRHCMYTTQSYNFVSRTMNSKIYSKFWNLFQLQLVDSLIADKKVLDFECTLAKPV